MSGIRTRCLTVTKYGEKIQFTLSLNLGEDTEVMFGLRTHKVCGGYVESKLVARSHYILRCRACGLRIIIPNEIDTYKKLKKYTKILRK